MPIYEFQCDKCLRKLERYVFSCNEVRKPKCIKCGHSMRQIFSVFTPKTYKEDCLRDLQDKPVRVGKKQDIKDAINKFNDSELASKQGKVVADLY